MLFLGAVISKRLGGEVGCNSEVTHGAGKSSDKSPEFLPSIIFILKKHFDEIPQPMETIPEKVVGVGNWC